MVNETDGPPPSVEGEQTDSQHRCLEGSNKGPCIIRAAGGGGSLN